MSEDSWRRRFEAPLGSDQFSGMRRFGHTSDVSKLFSNDSDEAEDYVRGLLFAAAFVMAIFLVWMILILVFMCMGQRRVGFLSGAPFQRPVREEDLELMAPPKKPVEDSFDHNNNRLNYNDDESSVQWTYHESNGFDKRPTRIRSCFLFCGLVFVTFAILSVTQGLTNLETTVDTVNENARNIDKLSAEAEDIVNSGLREVRSIAVNVRDMVVAELEGDICPGDPTGGSNEIVSLIENQSSEAVILLNELDDFVASNADEIEEAAVEIGVDARRVQEETENVDFTSWEGFVVLLPFTLIPSLLMAGTILSMFDVEIRIYNTFLKWVAVPVFVLLVVLCTILTSAMLMGASANSDFCLPNGRPEEPFAQRSVDSSIVRILAEEGYTQDSIEFRVARFYITQCISEDPFADFRQYEPKVNASLDIVTSLISTLKDETLVSELTLYCQRDFGVLEELLDSMLEVIEVVLDSVRRTKELIACEQIVPIYTSMFYDGTCTYSMSAVMWVFSGLLIMSVFGLGMITMRAAIKPTMYVADDPSFLMEMDDVMPGEHVVEEVSPFRAENDQLVKGGTERTDAQVY